MTKTKITPKRMLAWVLTLAMVFTLLPVMSVPALAAGGDTYVPLTITADSFEADIVVENTATVQGSTLKHAATFFDGNNNWANYAFFENGYNSNNNGLPVGGLLTFSDSGQNYKYQLAPYNDNNAVQISKSGGGSPTSGAFVFTTPGAYSKISILGAAGNGTVSFDAVVTYTDGSTDSEIFTAPNWGKNGYCDMDRVKLERIAGDTDISAGEIQTGKPIALYHFEIGTDPTKLIKELSFTYRSETNDGGIPRANLMAVSGCVSADVPSVPTAGAATDITQNGFTANWGAIGGATGYYLDISTSSDFSTLVDGYNNLTVTGTSQAVTGLTADTAYYYRVRAANENGQSISSAVISVETADDSGGSTDSALKTAIDAWISTANNGSPLTGLTVTDTDANTVTVSGTASETAADTLDLTIPAGVTLVWAATLESSADKAININSASGTGSAFNMAGGAITSSYNGTSINTALYNGAVTDITVSGGTISGGSGSLTSRGVHSSNGTLTIEGGTINGGTGKDSIGVYGAGGTLTMKGGTIQAGTGNDAWGINIDGAQLVIDSGATLSGIDNIRFKQNGKVTAPSGTFIDRGITVTETNQITVGAANAEASVSGLSEGIYEWNGTAFAKDVAITSITATPLPPNPMTSAGGTAYISVSTINLPSGTNITVTAFDGETATTITGTFTTGMLTFPANTDAADKVYTIKASLDGGSTWSTVTTTVTVPGTGGGTDSAIDMAAIPGVTVPAALATPVTAITETAQYTGTVTWSPTVSGTFDYDTAYTATITLTPKSGYTLTGVTQNFFTVAGATTVSNSADSSVITAVFPETAAADTYSISASTLSAFGSLQTPYTQPSAQTVTITNTGTGSVTLTQPTATDYNIGTLSTTTLAAGAAATFTVQPKASLAVGNYNETITISGDNGASTTVSANFTVTAATTYSISADALTAFGSLQTPYTQPSAQTVTITNTGTGSVTLTQPTATDYNIGTLSTTTLAAGAAATFTVQPKASLAVGNYNETITISGDNGASTTVSASFTVTAAAVTVTSVTVKTAPTKTTYTAGETLDLTGLVVALHKSDSSTEDVAFTSFGSKNITANPTNGTALTTAHTGVTITYTIDNKTANQAITVNAAQSYAVTINGSYASSTGAGNYAQGATVTINAGSRSNYSFNGWTVNSGGVTLTNANSATTTFTMPTNAVSITANWSYNGGSGGGGGSTRPDPTPAAETPSSNVIVDGKEVNAGEVETKGDTTTVTVNQETIQKQLETANDNVTVVVPSETGTAVAQLVVQNVDDMASKEMTLTVQVGDVAYEIPTSAIDTLGILAALGAENAADVPISISITTDMSEAAQTGVNNAVVTSGGELVIPPMEFKITATYEGKTVEIDTFGQYVSRAVEVTAEQAARITTAIVVESNGTTRQVPTNVYQKNGKWYAEINSLTNSTYALVYNDVAFADAKGKWYEAVVNEMGSRMIISGVGGNLFDGERDITRAEFAAILVKALGLPANGNGSVFTDVPRSAWYYGAVGTAYQYGLVSGVGDNNYAPDRSITRQEAMLMIQRASSIMEFGGQNGSLNSFTDANTISNWAKDAAVWNVGSGLIVGSDGKIRGTDNITRAETATLVLKLLQKAGLVDVRTKF